MSRYDEFAKTVDALLKQYGGGALALHSVSGANNGDRLCVFTTGDGKLRMIMWRAATNDTVEVVTCAVGDGIEVVRALREAVVNARRVPGMKTCLCNECVRRVAPDCN